MNAEANANAHANDAGDPFATLAARGAKVAPLLVEASRFSGTTSVVATRDLCVRAVVDADGDVDAWMAAADGPRGAVAHGRTLVLPPNGPACARKGETLRVVVGSDGGVSARGIVYVSP